MKTMEDDVRGLLDKIYWLFYKKWNSDKQNAEAEFRELFYNQQLPKRMVDPKTKFNKIIYQSNKIRTTKYTPLTFLPLNIFFQFTNIANSYFLFIIILGCFNIFGVQNPSMQAVPLIIIVVLTAFKDGFEDYRRATADYEMNSSKVHKLIGIDNFNAVADNVGPWRRFKKLCSKRLAVIARKLGRKKTRDDFDLEGTVTNGVDIFSLTSENLYTSQSRLSQASPRGSLKFHHTQWKSVLVGDIIRVKKNEEVPADCIILKSSNENGTCYVETKNLDGETNLKTKTAIKFSEKKIKSISDLGRLKFSVKTELPHKDLYSFHGVIHEEDIEGLIPSTSESMNIENLILRGSVLRNTNYVIGMVIATGSETKIMLNSGVTPSKKSKISRNLNYYVLVNFLLLFIMCFVAGLINGLYYRKQTGESRLFFDFNYGNRSAAANGTLTFFVNLIMYQTLVPISLYITVEIIKSYHAIFIFQDVNMYYERLDLPCTPKSWSIADDLGQIEYIFSDKTGTLTQNVMEFKKCSVANKSYGLAYTSAQEGYDKRMGNIDIHAKIKEMNALMKKEENEMCVVLEKCNPFFKKRNLTFISQDFVEELNTERNHEFLLALALCHSAIIEYEDLEDADDASVINYSAESPDEVALVSFARDMGVAFLGKEENEYLVFDNGKELRFKLLCTIPFTSARKRMSVVVQNSNGEVFLYMKGADIALLQRSVKGEYDESIKNNLEEFSNEGLRTLVIGYKKLHINEFQNFNEKYADASKLIDEKREIQMDELANDFENGVTLIGATAIDDKLQDDVPNTIESLRKAGIKVWVLTGDKVETAISIGYSCSMLNNNMDLIRIQADDCEELEKIIDNQLIETFGFENPNDSKHIKEAKSDHSIPDETHALLIDGKTLSILFDQSTDIIQKKFLMLGKKCCSVLCCRVSPSQKADVVKLVKNNLDVITLAIGDGANDVSMIQSANIGVGIAGEEGRQAAMSSDYALGQFKYLQRLLLVHGKWSYQRLSIMVPCFFYKNIIFVMPLFWYGIFTDFDGTYLYEYTFLMLFNLFFTSVPVITLGALDQDVPDYISVCIPQLYRAGIQNNIWTEISKFTYYMGLGLYQSAIAFFFPYSLFQAANYATHNGLSIDAVFSVGVFSIHIAIFACNFCMLLAQKRWDRITIFFHILSNLLLFIWVVGWSSSVTVFYQLGTRCYQSASFWACTFVGFVLACLPDVLIDTLRCNFFPNDVDKIRAMLKLGFFEKPQDLESATDKIQLAKLIGGLSDDDTNDGTSTSKSIE